MLRARDRTWTCRISVGTLVMIGALMHASIAFGTPESAGGFLSDPSASFSATWNRTELSAKVFNRPTGQENRLTLHGRIEILDCNNLYGMYVGDPNILQVSDAAGEPVEWQPVPFRGMRSYQRLMYDSVLDPPSLTKPIGSTWKMEVHPFEVSVQLLLDPNTAVPTSLSQINWSVRGLYAERIIEVDVPFETSREWREVAPGLRILVRYAEVQCDRMHHKYLTEVECLDGSLAGFDDELIGGEGMADYAVLESLLVDSQGKPLVETARFPPSSLWSESAQGSPWGNVSCSGLLVWADPAKVARIRHIIAVHPVEVEIPFVWTDVPMPILQTAIK